MTWTRGTCVVVLVFLASFAHAQVIYKCKGADGKVTFADKPCPGQSVQGAPATAKKPAAASRRATRSEVLERWKLSDNALRSMEEQCAKGDSYNCSLVEGYYTRTPAEVDRELRAGSEQACKAGNKAVCDALESRKREEEKLRRACASGNKQSCDTLSTLAQ